MEWIVVAIIAIITIVAGYIYGEKKDNALKRVAHAMGFSFHGNASLGVFSSHFLLFSKADSIKIFDMFHKRVDSIDMKLFTYKYTRRIRRNHDERRTQTVILFQSHDLELPEFELRPETFGDKIDGTVFGFQDIDFYSHAAFSSQYVLRGADEKAVRNLFTDNVLAHFARKKGICVEGYRDTCIYYRASKEVKPKHLRSSVDEGLAIVNLLRTSSRSTRRKIDGQSSQAPTSSTRGTRTLPQTSSMPVDEPRYDCPVCLGVKMTKLQPSPQGDLVLDHCQRCGGIWFDHGEVQLLRRCRPQVLWRKIVLQDEAYRMQCHFCHASMERNVPQCPACAWNNVIACPVCTRSLQPMEYHGLKLDRCKPCRGVWFDQIELAEIWNLQLESLTKERRHTSGDSAPASGEAAAMFLEVLAYTPDFAVYGAEAVVQSGQAVADVAADVVSNIPEVAGAVVETTGSLAGGVFETIAQMMSELLDF